MSETTRDPIAEALRRLAADTVRCAPPGPPLVRLVVRAELARAARLRRLVSGALAAGAALITATLVLGLAAAPVRGPAGAVAVSALIVAVTFAVAGATAAGSAARAGGRAAG